MKRKALSGLGRGRLSRSGWIGTEWTAGGAALRPGVRQVGRPGYGRHTRDTAAALAIDGIPQLRVVGRAVAEFRPRLEADCTTDAPPRRQRRVLASITDREIVIGVVHRHGTP